MLLMTHSSVFDWSFSSESGRMSCFTCLSHSYCQFVVDHRLLIGCRLHFRQRNDRLLHHAVCLRFVAGVGENNRLKSIHDIVLVLNGGLLDVLDDVANSG